MSPSLKPTEADGAHAPDPVAMPSNRAAGEMIAHLGAAGVETVIDRLQAQQPQCGFGLNPGSAVVEMLCGEGLPAMLGSRLIVEPDPSASAAAILAVLDEKRASLDADDAADDDEAGS